MKFEAQKIEKNKKFRAKKDDITGSSRDKRIEIIREIFRYSYTQKKRFNLHLSTHSNSKNSKTNGKRDAKITKNLRKEWRKLSLSSVLFY